MLLFIVHVHMHVQVSLDETQHIWKILQAASAAPDSPVKTSSAYGAPQVNIHVARSS